MTTTLRVRFDGKVLVPEGPVDLPTDRVLEVHVEEAASPQPSRHPLAELADLADSLPTRVGPRTDRAAQHDHHLYGTPKRP